VLMFLSAEKVTIIPVPGRWYSARDITGPVPATHETAALVRSLLNPVQISESDPRLACNPVMPATAPVLGVPSATLTQAPLKGSRKGQSAVGYRSGARSAVIPVRIATSLEEWVIAETVDGTF
jgi:hypothetical protein